MSNISNRLIELYRNLPAGITDEEKKNAKALIQNLLKQNAEREAATSDYLDEAYRTIENQELSKMGDENYRNPYWQSLAKDTIGDNALSDLIGFGERGVMDFERSVMQHNLDPVLSGVGILAGLAGSTDAQRAIQEYKDERDEAIQQTFGSGNQFKDVNSVGSAAQYATGLVTDVGAQLYSLPNLVAQGALGKMLGMRTRGEIMSRLGANAYAAGNKAKGAMQFLAGKTVSSIPTMISMSAPEMYDSLVRQMNTDANGNYMGPVNLPSRSQILWTGFTSVAHAMIENGFGIDPAKVGTKTARQALKPWIKDVVKTAFGEGSEEVAQNVIDTFSANLATKPIGDALVDSFSKTFSKEGLMENFENFLGGFIGGGGMHIGGKATQKNMGLRTKADLANIDRLGTYLNAVPGYKANATAEAALANEQTDANLSIDPQAYEAERAGLINLDPIRDAQNLRRQNEQTIAEMDTVLNDPNAKVEDKQQAARTKAALQVQNEQIDSMLGVAVDSAGEMMGLISQYGDLSQMQDADKAQLAQLQKTMNEDLGVQNQSQPSRLNMQREATGTEESVADVAEDSDLEAVRRIFREQQTGYASLDEFVNAIANGDVEIDENDNVVQITPEVKAQRRKEAGQNLVNTLSGLLDKRKREEQQTSEPSANPAIERLQPVGIMDQPKMPTPTARASTETIIPTEEQQPIGRSERATRADKGTLMSRERTTGGYGQTDGTAFGTAQEAFDFIKANNLNTEDNIRYRIREASDGFEIYDVGKDRVRTAADNVRTNKGKGEGQTVNASRETYATEEEAVGAKALRDLANGDFNSVVEKVTDEDGNTRYVVSEHGNASIARAEVRQSKYAQRIDNDTAKSIVDYTNRNTKTGVKVQLVESQMDIPNLQLPKGTPIGAQVEGWTSADGKTIYIVRRNFRNAERLRQVIMHEVVVHHGIGSLLTAEEQKKVYTDLSNLRNSDKQVAAAWEHLTANQPGLVENGVEEYGEELLAILAEQFYDNPSSFSGKVAQFFDSICNAIRRWYRRTFDSNLAMSKKEIIGLLRDVKSSVYAYGKMFEEDNPLSTVRRFVDDNGRRLSTSHPFFSIRNNSQIAEASSQYYNTYYDGKGKQTQKKVPVALSAKDAANPINDGRISREILDAANKQIEEMCSYMAPFLDKTVKGRRYMPEEVYGKGVSTIFDNASYGKTMENSLICWRTLAYIEFCDKVKAKLGRPLTVKESFLVSQKLYDISTDPQCLYCYVSLDRKAYDESLLKYIQQRDSVLSQYKAEIKGEATKYRLPPQSKVKSERASNPIPDNAVGRIYKQYLKGREDSYDQRERFNNWLDIANSGAQMMSMDDVANKANMAKYNNQIPQAWKDVCAHIDEIEASYGSDTAAKKIKAFKESKPYRDAYNSFRQTVAGQITDATGYAQSASWAKKLVEYRSYMGELLHASASQLKGLLGHYGLRFYSFSEFSPAFIVENMQMVRDAALRNMKGFAYTKKADFVEIFAPTGMNFNMGCFGYWKDGKMVMDDRIGCNWDEVKALRKKYKGVGATFVATDREAVKWALDQDWIDVIIPFHIVRTGDQIAKDFGWENFKGAQEDKMYSVNIGTSNKPNYRLAAMGEAGAGWHTSNIYPDEHMNDREAFIEAIKKRGWISKGNALNRFKPRFEEFIDHPNYMRLVNETRRSSYETPVLTPVFNTDYAKKDFDEFTKLGGYEGNWYLPGTDVDKEVNTVASDIGPNIDEGKLASEVEYGFNFRRNVNVEQTAKDIEGGKFRKANKHGKADMLKAGKMSIKATPNAVGKDLIHYKRRPDVIKVGQVYHINDYPEELRFYGGGFENAVYSRKALLGALQTHSNPYVVSEDGKHMRHLTSRETSRLMGFSDEEFDRISDMSHKEVEFMMGNSIAVPVAESVIKDAFRAVGIKGKPTLISLFSGVGAPEAALERMGGYRLIKFSEINPISIRGYKKMHNADDSQNLGDITKVDFKRLPKNVDLVFYGFPCQDLTPNGKRKGFTNADGSLTRSGLFYKVAELLKTAQPKIAIAENSSVLFDKNHWPIFKPEIEKAGYNVYGIKLNAAEFGLPANRLRTFAVAIRKDLDDGSFKFTVPEKYVNRVPVSTILETDLGKELKDLDFRKIEARHGKNPKFSLVTDPKTIDRLNKDSKTKAYRAMLLIDGKLYPPMASMEQDDKGKYRLKEHQIIGKWYKSDERPELITGFKETKKNGRYGHIYIRKDNGTGVDVAYNPYFHSSFTPLNDQFKTAYKRPNLVVVEMELANSDLGSGYRAEYSKDPVGLTEWRMGSVASQLAKQGKPARKVYLSQYGRVTRIVPDSEVAAKIKDMFEGTNLAIPNNVVTPSLLKELKKIGVPIKNVVRTDDDDRPDGTNGSKGKKKSRLSLQSRDAEYMKAVKANDMETAQKMVNEAAENAFKDSKIRDKNNRLVLMYHGTNAKFNEFEFTDGGKNGTAEGFGIYLSDSPEVAKQYGNRTIKAYANVTRPASSERKTISRAELVKLIKATCEEEVRHDKEAYGDDLDIRDSWISNYVNTYEMSLPIAYRKVADSILDMNSNDMNIIQEILSGMGVRNYENAERIHRVVTDVTGIDGYETYWNNNNKKTRIVLAFQSNQVKQADPVIKDDADNVIPLSERFNTKKKDIRFSLKSPIEETKDLIAVHNMSLKDLVKTLKLGGFPMPSIAITRASEGHLSYGDVSIVFGKETIDPSTNPRNKVYGSDAYTPTFPSEASRIKKKEMSELFRQFEKDAEEFYGYKPNKSLQRYLESKKEFTTDKIAGFVNDILRKNGEIIIPAYLKEKGLTDLYNEKNQDYKYYMHRSWESLFADDFDNISFMRNSNYDVKSWLESKIKDMVEEHKYLSRKKGTNSLPLPNNLFGILQRMKQEKPRLWQKDWDDQWANSPIHIAALISQSYKNIDEIKEDSRKRLYKSENFDWIADSLSSELLTNRDKVWQSLIANNENRRYVTYDDKELNYDENLFVGEANEDGFFADALVDWSETEDLSFDSFKNSFYKTLKEYYKEFPVIKDITANNFALEEYYKTLLRIAKMPTKYFEAKPRRVVGIHEIKKVLMPNRVLDVGINNENVEALKELRKALEEYNIPYDVYSDDKDRITKLNRIPNARFSINTSNLKQKWFAQMDAMRKKNEDALNERNRLRNRTLKEKIKDFAKEFPDNYEYWMSNHRQRLQRWLKKNAAPLFGSSGIPDDLDPNMMLDTIDGRVQSKRDEFYDTNVQPIIDFLREKKINASDFNQFLFAMHAEERAKQIFKVNPEMQKFGVGATGWNYSETPDECKDRLFNKYGRAELMKAGQMFWDMNDKLVDKQVEYGLWSEDTAKSVRAAYKHYCPMKRLDDQSIYEGIVYYDPKNEDRKQTTANTATNKRAMGRTSTPEHQFMFAVAAIDSVFRAGERNLAHQAMFKIAEKVMDPSIQLGQQKVVRFMDSDGEVAYRVAFEREPQTVVARFKGNPTTIHFDDPELYNAFTSPKGTAGLSMALARILRASTSAMASNATSRNFDFGAVNLFKDNQQAFTENAATKGKGFAWNVVRNLLPAMKTAYRYMTKGAVDADTSMYKEFLDNGGATGYLDVYKLDKYAETIEEEINSVAHSSLWDKIKYDGSRPLGTANRFIRHALAKFYKPFEFFNEILESATRFANYRAYRKNHSAARSAEHAKNITLNFNRHGALWTSEFNWVYMFSNAAIQAGIKSAKVFGELSKSRKGRLALASVILTGLIARLFNRGFSGRDPEDDELYYDKIPEYKKKSNLVIMKPNGKDYWSFPLQTTLALPYMVGDNLAAWLNGERTMLETTGDSLKGIMDALNPLGSDSRWWAWIVPTSVRPVTDVVSNTNFVGSPIHPEQSSFGPQMPKYQKHFRNTAKIYIDIAKALNEISGGNQYESGSIDLYPDDIRHLWTSYTGGFYRLIGKYVGNKTEDWVNPAKMPILSRFNGEVDDRKTRSDFNDYNDLSMKISKAKDEQQKWFLDKYPNNSVLTNAVKVANKRLQLLRTQFNKGLIDDETYQSHSVTAMKTAIGKIRKAGFK